MDIRDGRIIHPCGELTTCSFCGQEAARAFWSTAGEDRGDIRVCWPCAVEVLPALIADALAGPYTPDLNGIRWLDPSRFQQELPKILSAYWRAVSLALGRRIRALTKGGGGSYATCLQCHKLLDINGVCTECLWDQTGDPPGHHDPDDGTGYLWD